MVRAEEAAATKRDAGRAEARASRARHAMRSISVRTIAAPPRARDRTILVEGVQARSAIRFECDQGAARGRHVVGGQAPAELFEQARLPREPLESARSARASSSPRARRATLSRTPPCHARAGRGWRSSALALLRPTGRGQEDAHHGAPARDLWQRLREGACDIRRGARADARYEIVDRARPRSNSSTARSRARHARTSR